MYVDFDVAVVASKLTKRMSNRFGSIASLFLVFRVNTCVTGVLGGLQFCTC